MREENEERLKAGRAALEKVKELRGGSVISTHKRMANDPELLEAFAYNFEHCFHHMFHCLFSSCFCFC